ncbi:MAG: hypothetical protein FJ298_02615 [Planctomycetes bacterium]|nr:hypothetical protein [Planctomycetota bacterium]
MALLHALALGLLAQPVARLAVPEAAETRVQEDRKAEFEKRLAAAEGNKDKLWKLYEWCDASGMEKDGRNVLRKIVKLDDADRRAHELLGEIEYDGKWFPSEKKVEEYKKKKLDEEAKKSGKVVYNGRLVDPADVPFLQKGLIKTDDGRWVDAEEQKKLAEGWVKQDLNWIAPAELANLEKNLWKCGDTWLAEADANKFHAELDRWWKIPSDHYVLFTTCDRALAMPARDECERAFREVNRVLGKTPSAPVAVLVLRSGAQYGEFAGQRQTELRGFSSLHGASIAEVWTEPFAAGMTSAGFCYWDAANQKDNAFGPMFVRHAAAQSLIEALDPSPKALASIASGKPGPAMDRAWWDEKQLPQWLRYGACAYAERYMTDPFIKQGGDPHWMRKWSLDNIANKGGIDPLDTILTLPLRLEDVSASGKLINQAGLLVAFMLDGKCTPVVQAHQAFKDAFKSGKDLRPSVKALEEALRKNEAELRKFAGI